MHQTNFQQANMVAEEVRRFQEEVTHAQYNILQALVQNKSVIKCDISSCRNQGQTQYHDTNANVDIHNQDNIPQIYKQEVTAASTTAPTRENRVRTVLQQLQTEMQNL